VRVPALDAVDGGGGVGTFSVDTKGGATFETLFTYIAAGDPEVNPSGAVTLSNIGVPHYIGVPRRVTYP